MDYLNNIPVHSTRNKISTPLKRQIYKKTRQKFHCIKIKKGIKLYSIIPGFIDYKKYYSLLDKSFFLSNSFLTNINAYIYIKL